LRWKFITNKIW